MKYSIGSVEALIAREIGANISALVATLGEDAAFLPREASMTVLCERAHNLAADIPDFEAAAHDLDTWTLADGVWSHDEKPITYASAQALINGEGFDPYDIEVLEHWIVSEALAAKLTAMGQKVDTDFAGLCVWARTLKGSLEVDPLLVALAKEAMPA